jgi:hypothetical protein
MNEEALIQEMMRRGHSRSTAEATIQGRQRTEGLQNLWNEYMTGGGGQPGGGDYASNLIQTLTGQVVPQALEFDVEAARAAAEQEWNPYYDEILEDYLTKAALFQERSEADIASTLGVMGGRREEFMGDIARQSPIIQEQIGGRAADRGLYFSGGREQEQRRQLEKEERAKGSYERKFEYVREQKELEQQRYVEDLARKKKERERDLARQREAAITGQVETRRSEIYGGYG